MSFSDILSRICSSGATRSNILTDGQFVCSYGDSLPLLEQIGRFLDDLTVSEREPGCVALECVNSVPGALLLMALLEKGISFVLAPPSGSDLKPTPHFCRHRVTVAPAEPADGATLVPVRYLRAERNPLFNGRPESPSKIYLRTSGSMGISKLVVHSHEKMLGNAANCITKYGFGSSSRAAIPVPVAHMYGFGAEFLPAVMAGASIDLQEKTHLLKYLERERQFQPNIVFATPTLCEILMKGYKSPRTNYSVFVTSGQRIGEELFRSFDLLVNGRLINQYGSTEMGATAACDPGDTLDRRATTIGKPMPGVDLRLEPLPGEESGGGQLYCRHPYGYEGYVDEDGNPLGDIAAGGWYLTGDLALNAPDGSIVVTGRADASVNRRGYLVLLSDIERKMERFAAVRGVIVVAGRDENKQGQRIAAFCVPRQGAAVDGPELRRQCFDVLPHYAVPDEVHITEELPMLASGKVDRRSLAALVG